MICGTIASETKGRGGRMVIILVQKGDDSIEERGDRGDNLGKDIKTNLTGSEGGRTVIQAK